VTGESLDLVSLLKWQETRFRKGLTYGDGHLCKMDEEMVTLKNQGGIFYRSEWAPHYRRRTAE
jgi:hypothetical protein